MRVTTVANVLKCLTRFNDDDRELRIRGKNSPNELFTACLNFCDNLSIYTSYVDRSLTMK